MKRIGLLGCGSIGTQIAIAIDTGIIPAKLTHIFDENKQKSASLASKLKNKPVIVENVHLLSSNPVDLVVEAASQDAVSDNALSILQNRKDLVIMSSGALLDESVFEIISDACRELKKTVYLPSGAISGIDAIKSVKGELDSVVLTTTKHPNSLKGAKFFNDFKLNVDDIKEISTIFEGTASEAVRLFPKNINVSALLSLSGLGSHETIVKIIADPNTTKNTHEISARGKFGQITTKIENVPDSNNPRTSRLAILSAIETIRSICTSDIKLGT
ncbi:MAG: aspartate dehydrogenase [Thaumarchaeota archaeon]|jgi:aspartate dehydrogenase|nr:aspartate dehydrogenase [Nitrososphaerota archaeon]MBT5238337.1 aspartate dehydrogenase [Nitrososphaerota archaeon]MBT7824405.1 aspartate dehydrogenase [Nitrososphaerota archaeon]|tara:strand:- start:786 stop:1604 length:819 start_codon:yes stop_codon:yes gene_type:complete